jgi:hypothetical protein
MSQPLYYQIRVSGELTSQWAEWFGGLIIAAQPGDGTLLAGWLPDQAALRGVLDRIFDLNLQLLSVSQGAAQQRDSTDGVWEGQTPL